MSNFLLTPAKIDEAVEGVKAIVAAQILEALDPEELQTIELAEAARYLGLSAKQAAKILPVIEVGPRTHRVSLKAFQGFKEAKTTWPDDAALRKYLERNKAKA